MSGSALLFIPAYNCAPQIPRVLAQMDAAAARHFAEIVVVDNRSTDDTAAAALAAAAARGDGLVKVVRNRENYGLGGSHKAAFAYALERGHDSVAVLHGDDQGRLADLTALLDAGEHENRDCLLGARFHPQSHLLGYSRFRTFGNRVFNGAFSLAAGRRLLDLGAGLNFYATRILADRFYLGFADDLTFNYCMILAHCQLRHRFRFFPIAWSESDQISNVRLVSQAKRALGLLARYRLSPRGFLAGDHRTAAREAYVWDELT